MYAIVDIAGQQFKIEKNQEIYVHRLQGNEGDQVKLDKVLLIDNNGDVNVGTPIIDGAEVTARIVSHVKGDKVIVFKKKRRKGYQKENGHRQFFSQILIEDITATGASKKAKKEKKSVAPETKEEVPEVQQEVIESPVDTNISEEKDNSVE